MKQWAIYFKEYHPEDDQPNPEQCTFISAPTKAEAAKKLCEEVGSIQIIEIKERYGYSNY
jgi:hypothetical protein